MKITISFKGAGTLLLALLSFPLLYGQSSQLNMDQRHEFQGRTSMFYYSDIASQSYSGSEEDIQPVLLAINKDDGGYAYSTTGENKAFVVSYGDKIYIGGSLQDLEVLTGVDDLVSTTQYTITIEGREPQASSNVIGLFFVQLESDQNPGDFQVHLEGIGISIIQDIDPTFRRGISIPEKQVFTIQTVQDCGQGIQQSAYPSVVVNY